MPRRFTLAFPLPAQARAFVFLFGLLAVSGCGGGGGGGGNPPGPAPASGGFAFGVEYMEAGLGATYAATGVTWAKTRLEAFAWGQIEPSEPVGGVPTYSWDCTDAAVAEYQAAGIVNMQSYLTPKSSWASEGALDIMPKAQYMDAWRRFVADLFERYDGDGVDDMPGLVRGITHWVIGPEWTGFWPSGDADDYIALLEATRDAAKAVFPDCQLGTIPFMLEDVFHGNEPTAQEIADRLADPNPVGRNLAAGIYTILDRPDLFDAVCIHSLGHYTEIPVTLRWFRQQMSDRGYTKPIWFDDAFPMPLLANAFWPSRYPIQSQQQRDDVFEILRDVGRLQEPDYSIARAWVDAEVAKGVVQKVIVAAAEGARGIHIGNTEDWMHDTSAPSRDIFIGASGAAVMMGAINVTHNDVPDPYEACKVRTPGAPRASYRNMALVAERIGDGTFDSITKLSLGGGVWAYRFEDGTDTWFCLWSEDDVLQLIGEVEPLVPVTLPLPAGTTQVETFVAATTAAVPTGTLVPVVGDAIDLQLSSVPVFVHVR